VNGKGEEDFSRLVNEGLVLPPFEKALEGGFEIDIDEDAIIGQEEEDNAAHNIPKPPSIPPPSSSSSLNGQKEDLATKLFKIRGCVEEMLEERGAVMKEREITRRRVQKLVYEGDLGEGMKLVAKSNKISDLSNSPSVPGEEALSLIEELMETIEDLEGEVSHLSEINTSLREELVEQHQLQIDGIEKKNNKS